MILYGIMMQIVLGPMVREWEPFQKHSEEIRSSGNKMEFGEDQSGPAVIVVGTVRNSSPVDWKEVRLQVDFFDKTGQLFDTGQQKTWMYRLPANQNTSFKVSFRRQFPEKKYAKHTVYVVSAVDSRKW